MARAVHVRIAPVGIEVIAIWSGSIATIPSGFILDTRFEDLFARGVVQPDGSDLFATGGADTASSTHTHPFYGPPHPPYSDMESSHGHSTPFGTSSSSGNGLLGFGAGTGAGAPHTHAASGATTATYGHHHSFEGIPDSATVTIDTRPPHLALAYIRGVAEIPLGAITLYGQPAATLLPFTAGPTTTLAAGVGAGTPGSFETWTITADPGIGAPGIGTRFTFFIGTEQVVCGYQYDPLTWYVGRGYNGTPTAAHAAGSAIAFPKYAICDGLGDTPSLVDSFVIGVDNVGYFVDIFYGSNAGISGPFHDHTLTGVGVGSTTHVHNANAINPSSAPSPDSTVVGSGALLGVSPGAGHTHGIFNQDGDAGGAHSHGTTGAFMDPPVFVPPGPLAIIPRFLRAYYLQRVVYA